MKIRKDVVKEIIAHAKKEAPLEACGYLAQKNSIVLKHYALTNRDHSEDHFSFDPREQFEAIRDARRQGFEVCAVYHSHPFTPARPSAEDIKLSIDPRLSYVVVSLAGAETDIKAFRIKGEKVEQEDLEVVSDDSL